MAQKSEQGRFARMVAFWGLFLLLGYGCLGGLVNFVAGLLGDSNPVFVKPFPLLGELDLARVICLAVLAAGGFLIHRMISKPKAAEMLVETEGEMRKVTWPSSSETVQGALAVVVTVVVLFVLLTATNYLFAFLFDRVLGTA